MYLPNVPTYNILRHTQIHERIRANKQQGIPFVHTAQRPKCWPIPALCPLKTESSDMPSQRWAESCSRFADESLGERARRNALGGPPATALFQPGAHHRRPLLECAVYLSPRFWM